MPSRRSLSKSQRLDVLAAHNNCCYLCGGVINLARARNGGADVMEVEHIHPLALGGADDPSNWRPAHKACHQDKTRRDIAAMAKTRRIAAKTSGEAKASRHVVEGSTRSRFKKKMNGDVIDRETGDVISRRRSP